jgi:hypothetical protein
VVKAKKEVDISAEVLAFAANADLVADADPNATADTIAQVSVI